MAWPTESFDLTCGTTGAAHEISIGLPVREAQLTEAPLLFTLDGPWMFGTVLDATRIMSMSNEAPEAIVVGLSFADRSMGEYLRQRARWYTPTPWVPPPVTGVRGLEADQAGRAAELLAFIEDQAIPAVLDRLPDSLGVSERWLVGHSFSALFGLTALFRGCTTFDRWLLASPSIWWDGRSVLDVEAEYAASNTDLGTTIFTCYGREELDDKDDYFRMGQNVEELLATLGGRGYPGLSITREVIERTGHASSVGGAISAGLRALHQPPA
ncbi:MAG: alpha/beta hydrolase-fold protein [Actinomycetota bacterium]